MTALSAFASAHDSHSGWRRVALLSASQNVGFKTGTFDAESLGVHDSGAWSVKTSTLHGGYQEGVRLIEVDNGSIQIKLVPTRGMSILTVSKGALVLGWDSPIEEVVHPQWIDLSSRGGLGWLDGFNEFLVRCGLEFAGHPGPDEAAGADLTLHGRIGNVPAGEVALFVEESAPHRIRLRALVQERWFHGAKLDLLTELTTTPGSDEFEISDTVMNRGGVEQEFEVIYHTNYGAPLLEKGATFHAPARTVTPMNEGAVAGLEKYEVYAGPTPGFAEQVYLIEPVADENGQTVALLRNADGDAGASIRWSAKQLPHLTLWKNTVATEDGYVTGIEPGTSYPFNRSVEREFGRVPKLAAGASRDFRLTYALHDNAAEVQKVADQIAELQGGRAVKLVADPPVVP